MRDFNELSNFVSPIEAFDSKKLDKIFFTKSVFLYFLDFIFATYYF